MKQIPEIFKVQISLSTGESKPQVLIYNEKRTREIQFDLTPEIKKLMKGKAKDFYWGRMKGTEIELLVKDGSAEWQDW